MREPFSIIPLQFWKLRRPDSILLDPKSTGTFEKCFFYWLCSSASSWRFFGRKIWHQNSFGIHLCSIAFCFDTFDSHCNSMEFLGFVYYQNSHWIGRISHFPIIAASSFEVYYMQQVLVEYPNLLLKTFSTTVILNETMNKTTTTI